DTALVGAWGDDDAGSDSGSAYVYVRAGATWTQRTKLVDSDAAAEDRFGWFVSLSGGTALVGAFLDNDAAGADQGSARFFNVGPEDLPALVYNTTLDSLHGSLSDAINGAASSNVIEASAPAFWTPSAVNYLGKLLELNATTRVRQPYHNAITLSDGSSLAAEESLALYGEITNQGGHNATLRAPSMRVGSGGVIVNSAHASLDAQIGETTVGGALNSFAGSTLSFSGALTIEGEMSMFDATFSGPSLGVGHGGRFVGDGTLSTSVTNSDAFITVDSTLLTGDLTNNAGARVTVQIGTLTVLGSLTNNGTIVGDLQTLLRSGTMPGDGFSVGGHYSAGPDASLLMSSDLWRVRVGGDYNVAIDDNAVYDLSEAELNLTGALPSRLEVMSTDIDNSFDGLDRTIAGHYPIGTLRLSGGNTVELVDEHDNDGLGQSANEAIYTSELIVEAGATLNTNGLSVYYETLSMGGTVDDPSRLIQLVECAGDFNGDGFVNGADLGLLLANWGLAGAADLNGDGTVNGADLGLLLAAWGAC
ncbi:MAG: dockerin type I domain-containing protein, partial [Planctomycetota bacterium]